MRISKKTRFLFIGLATLLFQPLAASDVIKVLPLTEKIIMVHFKDGFVDHFGYGQTDQNDVLVADPLNLDLAMLSSSYSISSPDDPNYASPVFPNNIYRKSKGVDFSRNCMWNGSQCINDIAFEHQIFLNLPNALVSGKTYRISLGDLAYNLNNYTLFYDADQLRSEAVHLNQLGFAPAAPKKYGYVSYWLGDGGPLNLSNYEGAQFELIDLGTGNTVFGGNITLRTDKNHQETAHLGDTPNGNFQAADVYEADFSNFTIPGEYRLCVAGIGCSFPFEIGADVYREAFYYACRGLYFQRAGIDKGSPYAEHWHPADHHPSINGTKILYTPLRFMDFDSENGDEDEVLANITDTLDFVHGWYHDAGDWDGYTNHTKVPKALMYTFECGPDRFFDGELNIPESNNGIPDILDEAFWLIEYFRRNTGPSGGKFGARIHGNFEDSPGDGVPSWEDPRNWVTFGEDSWTTFEFAGLAAHMAWCLELDEQINGNDHNGLISTLIQEAETAYAWAVANTQAGDENKALEQMLYANAALYKVTENVAYQTAFQALNPIDDNSGSDDFRNYKWGLWSFALLPNSTNGLNTALYSLIRDKAIAHADFEDHFAYEDKHSFRYYGNYWQPMSTGQATTPKGLASIVAFLLTAEQKYLQGLYTTADYFLGGNQLNQVWLTGLGDQHPKEILHLDSWLDNQEGMIPGIVPYGPSKAGDHFMGSDFNGPWDADYNRNLAVYPNHETWPGHELWFENRYTVISNEFTVHQTNNEAAAVYGYLSSSNSNFIPNQKPTGTITAPINGSILGAAPALLQIDATDPDGYVGRVEYYFDWHKIGESSTAPFDFSWADKPDGTFDIQAVVFDNKGLWVKTNTITVTVDNTIISSTTNTERETAIRISPNPFQDNLQITIPNWESGQANALTIFHISGQLIHRLIPENNTINLSLADQSSGIYLVKYGANQIRIIKK